MSNWLIRAKTSMGLDGAAAIEFQTTSTTNEMTVAADRTLRRTPATRSHYRFVAQPPRYRIEGAMVAMVDGKEAVVSKDIWTFNGKIRYHLNLLNGLLVYSQKAPVALVSLNENPLAQVFAPFLGENRPNTATQATPYDFLTFLDKPQPTFNLGFVLESMSAKGFSLTLPTVTVTEPETNYFPGLIYLYTLDEAGLPIEITKKSIAIFPDSFVQALTPTYFSGDGKPASKKLPQDGYVGETELTTFTYENHRAVIDGKARALRIPTRATRLFQGVVSTHTASFANDLNVIPAVKNSPDTWAIPWREVDMRVSQVVVGHDSDEEFTIDASYARQVRNADREP